MSKTFSVAIEIVVTTTTSEPRMPGTVTFVNRCQALVPSSCGRLDLLGRDALDRRAEHDHREPGLDPDHHDDEQEAC